MFLTISTVWKLLSVLSVCACSLTHAVEIASYNQTVASPMTADKVLPQLSQVTSYANLFAPDMAQYLDAADSECTIIVPDNKAVQRTMAGLGSYVGLFMQNQTMQQQVLNHHVIPNRIILAADFGDGGQPVDYQTRANQTLWLLKQNGQPYVAFGQKYVVPIEIANIKNKRNKCVLHVVSDQILIPPGLLATFEDWQQRAGKPEGLASPQSTWVPSLTTADNADATATAAPQPAAADAHAAPVAEARSKPASGTSSLTVSRCRMTAAAAAAASLVLVLQ